jgi:hypothetical protein
MDPINLSSPLEAVRMMHHFGLVPDPWQLRVLESDARYILLNCCRQAGKTTVVAALALSTALFQARSQVLIMSASERQAREVLHTIGSFHRRLNRPLTERCTLGELEFSHGSRIISLPCKEATIRGYSNISLVIIDEAARVPEDIYIALMPMLAVSRGRIIVLSTPNGRQGFFHEAWANGSADWMRVEVPAEQVPRIAPEFLAQMRRQMGESKYRQEFCCSFTEREGLVYPDFPRAVVPGPAPAGGRRIGGVDYGFKNPFAAVWGTVDGDGVLWLTGEHYVRRQPITHHAARLPKGVTWYCDPSGAQQRCDLVRLGHKVLKGTNALESGIARVTARLSDGTLRVVDRACPNLVYEATLYCWDGDEDGSEAPVSAHNHALDALRYLVSGLDRRPCAVRSPADGAAAPGPGESAAAPAAESLEEQRERAWRQWGGRYDWD